MLVWKLNFESFCSKSDFSSFLLNLIIIFKLRLLYRKQMCETVLESTHFLLYLTLKMLIASTQEYPNCRIQRTCLNNAWKNKKERWNFTVQMLRWCFALREKKNCSKSKKLLMWNLRLSLVALGKKAGKPKTGLAVQSESKGNLEAFMKTH